MLKKKIMIAHEGKEEREEEETGAEDAPIVIDSPEEEGEGKEERREEQEEPSEETEAEDTPIATDSPEEDEEDVEPIIFELEEEDGSEIKMDPDMKMSLLLLDSAEAAKELAALEKEHEAELKRLKLQLCEETDLLVMQCTTADIEQENKDFESERTPMQARIDLLSVLIEDYTEPLDLWKYDGADLIERGKKVEAKRIMADQAEVGRKGEGEKPTDELTAEVIKKDNEKKEKAKIFGLFDVKTAGRKDCSMLAELFEKVDHEDHAKAERGFNNAMKARQAELTRLADIGIYGRELALFSRGTRCMVCFKGAGFTPPVLKKGEAPLEEWQLEFYGKAYEGPKPDYVCCMGSMRDEKKALKLHRRKKRPVSKAQKKDSDEKEKERELTDVSTTLCQRAWHRQCFIDLYTKEDLVVDAIAVEDGESDTFLEYDDNAEEGSWVCLFHPELNQKMSNRKDRERDIEAREKKGKRKRKPEKKKPEKKQPTASKNAFTVYPNPRSKTGLAVTYLYDSYYGDIMRANPFFHHPDEAEDTKDTRELKRFRAIGPLPVD